MKGVIRVIAKAELNGVEADSAVRSRASLYAMEYGRGRGGESVEESRRQEFACRRGARMI